MHAARVILFLSFLFIIQHHFTKKGRAIRAFESSCFCNENSLSIVATCTAVGEGLTIWEGSAFQCPGRSITLRHSQFSTSEKPQGTCNNGAILACATGVDGSDYTSKLYVSLTNNISLSSFYNKTVMCTHDHTNSTNIETTIGSIAIKIINDSPKNVQLHKAMSGKLLFTWDPVVNDCGFTTYLINAKNCGKCPTTTVNETFVTCAVIHLNDDQCKFSVQTQVCNITGIKSSSVNATLNGNSYMATFLVIISTVATNIEIYAVSNVTTLHVLPVYFWNEDETTESNLHMIISKFNTTEPFEISQGISGSPTSYTLTYFDSFSQVTCGQFYIMANMCNNQTCIHTLNVSMLTCRHHANISVEVYATNVLGNGSVTMSLPSVLDRVNKILFVKVNFSSAEIYCGLHDITDVTSCIIKTIYGPEKDCHHHHPPSDTNHLNGATIFDMFTTDKVDILYLPQNEAFCFVAVALSAKSTEDAILKGGFTTKSEHYYSPSQFQLYFGVFGAIMVLLFAISIGTLALVISKAKSRQCHKFKMNQNTDTKLKIYEKVDIDHSKHAEIETATNVAYATCRKINQPA